MTNETPDSSSNELNAVNGNPRSLGMFLELHPGAVLTRVLLARITRESVCRQILGIATKRSLYREELGCEIGAIVATREAGHESPLRLIAPAKSAK